MQNRRDFRILFRSAALTSDRLPRGRRPRHGPRYGLSPRRRSNNLSEPVSNPESKPPVESGYRLLRALLRIWFALFFRKIRLLEEGFPATGAAVLVINHPAGLLDALILVAAFERQLHCVIEEKLVQGPVRGFLA